MLDTDNALFQKPIPEDSRRLRKPEQPLYDGRHVWSFRFLPAFHGLPTSFFKKKIQERMGSISEKR